VVGQRPGPAVGLPTRTEQGELGFCIYGGSGEFPRAVLAPSSTEEAFSITVHAFNLAEKYQIPVIILTDQYLASSYQTIKKFRLKDVKIDRGQILSEEESNIHALEYKRHLFTESGISPRAIPLQGKALVVTDSDEHDESGHMIEDADLRRRMVLKRLKKYESISNDIARPHLEEQPGANMTLIGWGSTYGSIKGAADMLASQGMKVNILHLSEIWPFPADTIISALKLTPKNIVIENNATSQLAHLIAAETGIKVTASVLKFDGRPFSSEYIVKELQGVI
jgi:2-oxoglutarate/2-oxoacid ferredoxin oxidoreductase subunit alpha